MGGPYIRNWRLLLTLIIIISIAFSIAASGIIYNGLKREGYYGEAINELPKLIQVEIDENTHLNIYLYGFKKWLYNISEEDFLNKYPEANRLISGVEKGSITIDNIEDLKKIFIKIASKYVQYSLDKYGIDQYLNGLRGGFNKIFRVYNQSFISWKDYYEVNLMNLNISVPYTIEVKLYSIYTSLKSIERLIGYRDMELKDIFISIEYDLVIAKTLTELGVKDRIPGLYIKKLFYYIGGEISKLLGKPSDYDHPPNSIRYLILNIELFFESANQLFYEGFYLTALHRLLDQYLSFKSYNTIKNKIEASLKNVDVIAVRDELLNILTSRRISLIQGTFGALMYDTILSRIDDYDKILREHLGNGYIPTDIEIELYSAYISARYYWMEFMELANLKLV